MRVCQFRHYGKAAELGEERPSPTTVHLQSYKVHGLCQLQGGCLTLWAVCEFGQSVR